MKKIPFRVLEAMYTNGEIPNQNEDDFNRILELRRVIEKQFDYDEDITKCRGYLAEWFFTPDYGVSHVGDEVLNLLVEHLDTAGVDSNQWLIDIDFDNGKNDHFDTFTKLTASFYDHFDQLVEQHFRNLLAVTETPEVVVYWCGEQS